MSKHTPGPWEWYTSNSYRRLGTTGEYHEIVYAVTYRDGQPGIEWRNEADARLIAAAPDLLAALQSIARNTCCDNCNEAALVARAAIAKAEGAT